MDTPRLSIPLDGDETSIYYAALFVVEHSNADKAQIEVARMHHRIANRRKDFHLKTAHKLCDQAQTIFAGDLNVKGLTRGMLRNDCVDAAFGQFLSLMAWVCWKRGVYFAKVNVA
jgi:putative transposase